MNYTGYLETDDPFFCVTLVADTFWVVLLTLPPASYKIAAVKLPLAGTRCTPALFAQTLHHVLAPLQRFAVKRFCKIIWSQQLEETFL